ncbi:MAG: sialidase family protein [Eubacteriales bacterium]|nr:sialidase family protein [Eubacteriales bacterium]
MEPVGRIILDMAPKPGNPRNSEGAFITLKDGRLLFVYSRFNGNSAADHAPASLAALWSGDGGETWTPEKIILTAEQDQAKNIMSVSLIRLLDGDIGLVYFLRRGFDDGKAHLRRSADEGITWSDPVSCVPASGCYVTNNARIVRLRSGRLVVPGAFRRTRYGPDGSVTFSGIATSLFFFSDDDGRTWSESTPCAISARSSRSGLQEPGVIELQNGMLYGWARTDLGVQYEMFSGDGGATWSAPQPSRFTSPCSPLSLKRDPLTGNLVALWNPIPEYITRPKPAGAWNGGRTPLVCSVSRDDGASWEEPIILEDEPDSGYCYIAMHFVHDELLLAYCAGGPDDGGCLNRLRIRKLPVPGRDTAFRR